MIAISIAVARSTTAGLLKFSLWSHGLCPRSCLYIRIFTSSLAYNGYAYRWLVGRNSKHPVGDTACGYIYTYTHCSAHVNYIYIESRRLMYITVSFFISNFCMAKSRAANEMIRVSLSPLFCLEIFSFELYSCVVRTPTYPLRVTSNESELWL